MIPTISFRCLAPIERIKVPHPPISFRNFYRRKP